MMDQLVAFLDHQLVLALEQIQRFVLLLVVLQGQSLSSIDMQDLPRIFVGMGEDQLVAPGLDDRLN